MRIWHTMSQERFLEELRMSAIAQNASRAVIDQLDQLVIAPTEEEIEERCLKAYEEGEQEGREKQYDDIRAAVKRFAQRVDLDCLEALMDAIGDTQP